ncbi:MAG: hypothetical protein GY832_11565 [Chloroflexi bacterium]|nr:hypothetical protein [Chloroflexota bacterium]
MATKANAHYVDCDINPTSDSWDCGGAGQADTYEYSYFSENSSVWGIPIEDGTPLTLPAGQAVIDRGGGIVGVPCPGNPFVAGQEVYLHGLTAYGTSAKTLTSGTTASELQFAANYVAETATGDEIPVCEFADTDVGNGRMVQDSNGNLYVGHVWNSGDQSYITKIDPDGVKAYLTGFAAPSYTSRVTGLAITDDDKYLYIGAYPRTLIKYSLTTSTVVWEVLAAEALSVGYNLAIDSSENIYIQIRTDAIHKINPVTHTGAALTTMGQRPHKQVIADIGYDIAVDNALGIVIAGGRMYCSTVLGPDKIALMYNLCVRTFDNSQGDTVCAGGTYVSGSLTITREITADDILVFGGYIYVLGGDYIYKYQWTGIALSEITYVSAPTYNCAIWADAWGNIVVTRKSWLNTVTDPFYYYDKDLNYLSDIENIPNTVLRTMSEDVAGGLYAGGNVADRGEPGGLPSGVTADQSRALWSPSDYSHLNGEEVQVLGDGAYLGEDTVASGAVTLDDDTTTNHVGLAYTSKLQPMKMDGEAHVKSIKRLYAQLYNTLGGRYGEELARLWEIVFKDRDGTFGSSPSLFEGHKELDFDGSYSRQGDVWIVQDDPLPMTVLGLIARVLMEDGMR